MHRRNIIAGQPFLQVEAKSVSSDSADLSLEDIIPVQAINIGAELLEPFLTGPLFPLRYLAPLPWKSGMHVS